MGCRELIQALRTAGDGKVRALQAEAEAQAERIRSEAEERIDVIRRTRERQRAAEAAKEAEALIGEAAADARRERIRAERKMAERLERLARQALPTLRNVGYAGVFGAFVQELPPLPWRTVRVNPVDVPLARSHFHDADVLPDERISGGLVAQTAGERVQVVNTFEIRFERLWEELLPDVMREVREACP